MDCYRFRRTRGAANQNATVDLFRDARRLVTQQEPHVMGRGQQRRLPWHEICEHPTTTRSRSVSRNLGDSPN